METPRAYLEAIIRRTKELREAAGYTQDTMSDQLGISRNTYVHYERIAPHRITILPIHLMPRFCDLTAVTLHYLITGKELPLLKSYRAINGQDKAIVDRFLGLGPDAPLDPAIDRGRRNQPSREHHKR